MWTSGQAAHAPALDTCQALSTLGLGHQPRLTASDAAALKSVPSLLHLSLQDSVRGRKMCRHARSAGFCRESAAVLKRAHMWHRGIETFTLPPLNLTGSQATSDVFHGVLALARLQVLLVGGLPCGLSDGDAASLAASPAAAHLRELDISCHAQLSDAALASLQACVCLTQVR